MQYPRDTVQSRIATALGDVRLAASAKASVGRTANTFLKIRVIGQLG